MFLLLLPFANVVCKGYVFTPVCHSVHRGVSASVHTGIHPPGQTPCGQTSPGRNPPWADTSPGRHPHADTPQADTPQADTSSPTGRHHPGRHPRADTPPTLGRHPTHPGQTPRRQTPPRQCMLGYTHPCPVYAGIHRHCSPAQCMLAYTVPSACWDRHGYCCGRYASYWNTFFLS